MEIQRQRSAGSRAQSFAALALILIASFFLLSGSFDAVAGTGSGGKIMECKPTPKDSLGPFYKPGAPVRSKVGEGYVLSGAVKSARDCAPVSGARVEFWLAGTDKEYHDEQRATVYPGEKGEYRFESNFPPPYMSRPSHIHVKVTADGYKELVTQHYPKKGESGATFDLVIEPSRK